ncbi:MAG: hypothetical protein ACYS4W_13415 [Planctomycetota bacterium]|jgi:hypothetical protein
MIQISSVQDAAIAKGRLVYKVNDYYLEFEPEEPWRDHYSEFEPEEPWIRHPWRIPVSTLSIMVTPKDRMFVSLDAYCPQECWILDTALKPPSKVMRRALRFECSFNKEGVATDVSHISVLGYFVNTSQKLIVIRFADVEPAECFEFAENLVAGVDENSKLVMIYGTYISL